MTEYTVFYVMREEEDLDYKADLFTAEDKPESAQEIKFEAENDNDAKKRVLELIQKTDRRPVLGVGKLKLCRPSKKKVGSESLPVLINLNAVKEPLRTSIKTQIGPLLQVGDLTEEDGKIRVKSREMLETQTRKKKKEAEAGSETEEVAHKVEDAEPPYVAEATTATKDETEAA